MIDRNAARALALPAACLAAAALAAAPHPITLEKGWTRPAGAGMNTAGYLTLVNRGPAERLVSAASPAAARVSIHESRMVGSVMTMRTLPGLAVPPGGRVSFRPGGYHLMLEGLGRALKPGDRVPVVLVFAPAGPVRAVLTAGAGPPLAGL